MTKKRSLSLIAILTVMVLISVIPVFAADGAAEASGFAGTFWAIVPPVIAIGLALITKEVYSSLFIGILAGGLLATSFRPLDTMDAVINDGLIAAVSDSAGIFIFLVLL
ncbi:MAG: Na+/H+ antiporter NhaC family protein, partial [Clostridia bacterium]|nr:Na+/H+ antiporter NhaC family protein [Clostridia bacterium]